MFRTNNPVISKVTNSVDFVNEEASYKGITLKVTMLVIIAMVAAIFAASNIIPANLGYAMIVIGGIGSFIFVLVGTISARASKVCSWLYSFFEGFLIGSICAIVEPMVPGISVMALAITASIFACMLIIYNTKIIRVTSRFQKVFMTVFFSMFIGSLILMIFGMFSNIQLSYGMVIGISVVYCILASFMLLMDFERIKTVVENRMDKKYEWMMALGLMVTLVWLFIEVLRLILLVVSRDN